MKIAVYLFFLLSISISCNQEQRKLESLLEEVLPGEWNILSFEIKNIYHSNMTEYGYAPDTILYDVGRMEFPEFEMDTLALNGGGNGVGLECKISIDNYKESFRMEKLIVLDENESMSYFRVNGNGLFEEKNQLTNLIEFTGLFWQNMFLNIETEDLITFTSTSGESIILTLQRS